MLCSSWFHTAGNSTRIWTLRILRRNKNPGAFHGSHWPRRAFLGVIQLTINKMDAVVFSVNEIFAVEILENEPS